MIISQQLAIAKGLPVGWRFLGPDPLYKSGGGWWDTGRGVHVLVVFRQIIAALDWSRGWNEEPDVWVSA